MSNKDIFTTIYRFNRLFYYGRKSVLSKLVNIDYHNDLSLSEYFFFVKLRTNVSCKVPLVDFRINSIPYSHCAREVCRLSLKR